jgi:hypothetical protein
MTGRQMSQQVRRIAQKSRTEEAGLYGGEA